MTKMVILCVDDNNIVLQGLKDQLMYLFGNKFIIETAESGDEALEIFTELADDNYEIPVVISDYLMPTMKGDELLERIHKISPKTLKVMLTGQASTSAVIYAINNANLFKYIEKPWKEEELYTTVNEAIQIFYKDMVNKEENEKLIDTIKDLSQKADKKTRELSDLQEKLKSMKVLSSMEKFSQILLILRQIGEFLDTLNSNNVFHNKQPKPVNVSEINSVNEYLEKEKLLYTTIMPEIEKVLSSMDNLKALMTFSQDEIIQPVFTDGIERALEEIDKSLKTIFSIEA